MLQCSLKHIFLKLEKKKDVLKYKIKFWRELTIAIPIWQIMDLCFGAEYILMSRLGGRR